MDSEKSPLKVLQTFFAIKQQVKAVVLDPDNEFNVERPLTKNDVQRLIQVGYMVGQWYIEQITLFLDLCGAIVRFYLTSNGHCKNANSFWNEFFWKR